MESFRNNMSLCKLLLFGDLSVTFEDDLRALLHVQDNPLLSAFLEQVGARIRDEIGNLSIHTQGLFPRFTTLIDLVSKLGETEGTPVLRFCLLSVCQIGQFLDFYSRDGRQYPTPQDTYCLGVCAGSFAAAAISCSHSLTELIPLAVEVAIVAFRTSLRSLNTRCDIVGSDQHGKGSWSVVVSGKESAIQQKIETYICAENLLSVWRPYISAVTPNHITLSGPPCVLENFVSANQLKSHELSVGSPYHAPHLFHEELVYSLTETSLDEISKTHSPYLTMLSPSTGQAEPAEDFKAVLEAVIRNCLIDQVRWDRVLDHTVRTICDNGIRCCELVPISSNGTQLLSDGLGRVNVDVHVRKMFEASKSSRPQRGRFADSKIAIIGYSGRFPDSASNEDFWELLRGGRDVHREIPPDRFNWRTHYDATGKTKNTSRIKYGCWIEEPGLFDARFFNISPREAENTDPAQRLAITTVYESMEMAGMVPNRTPSTQQDRIGVFFGTTSDDWREVNSGQNVDTYFIPGGNRAFVPGRISYFFRFSGPSLSMDTACSSSFAAIQTACAYLWRGECDTAVAGGTNVLTNPDNFVGLDRGHFLTTEGNCNTFDDGASGYCRSDAVGSVILKRLEDAEMDNDPIFGVISGATTNHCGQTDSITRPHEGDQTSVFKRIIRHAGVNPLDISYIEMHGTGTQAGDATEMNSVLSVFVPERQRFPRHPLHLGSAKACIGHAESASGVSSLIKVLMMMKHSEIPPHCGIKTKINHNYPLDLRERGVNIAFQPTPWLRNQACGKRYAFLNNFSAAGGNTAILLEDAPPPAASRPTDPRTFYVVAVSSKTAKSLKGNMESLINHLDTHPEISISELSYTTTARRMPHSYRVAAIGNDVRSISQFLKSKVVGIEPKSIPPASRSPKVAFIFTGQGAFYCGLGQELFAHVSSFREDVQRYDRIAQNQGFPSFLSLVQTSQAEKADDSLITQLAITCVQMALSRLWKSWGVNPSVTMGHSLGEYAALFAADVLSAADTIFLVGTRARLLKQCCKPGTHSMLAVKGTEEAVRSLIQGSSAEVACLNQPASIVLSGTVEEVDRLREVFKMAGHDTTILDLPFAFHSSQVKPILEEFEAVAQTVNFNPPAVPYISPLLSEIISESGVLCGSYLARACRGTVNFRGALEEASKAGLINEKMIWLEIGPHPICSGMVKGTLGSSSITAATLVKNTDTWNVLSKTLEILYVSGIEIDWNEYHRDFEKFNSVIELPRYSWDLKNYWIMYRNDFCLTKGEGLQPLQEAIETRQAFKYLSPSLQRVIEESHGDLSSTLLTESDVHDPKLLPIFTGHKVNGAELCPSSLWGDIALHTAKYFIEQRSMETQLTGMDVSNMNIQKPLVHNPNLTSQLFRVSASADWSSNAIKVTIFSITSQGEKTLDHCTCTIFLVPAQLWSKKWERNAYLVQSRIKALNEAVDDGDAHRLKPSIVYRLFANIVEYAPPYQGMREVVLDSNDLEAVSTVKFQVDSQGFCFNPQWMDSVGGVAGFIMNGNDSPHRNAEVFINHGWESMKFISMPEFGRTYYCYNRMQVLEGTMYAGDTYVFDGDHIIGIIEQVKFLGVPRRALDSLRPVGSKPMQANIVSSSRSARDTKPRLASLPITKEPTTGGKVLAVPPPREDIWLRILAIISEELGVSLTDLKSDTEFAELGLDSLLSLTIAGRIREELELDLPSTVFTDCSTVKELQQLHGNQESERTLGGSGLSTSEEDSGASTPGTSLASEKGGLDYIRILRCIISEETGIEPEDLTHATRLSDIGVDSLLALTAMGRLREIFEMDLPSTLFSDHETLLEIEKAIGSILGVDAKPVMSNPAATTLAADDLQAPVVNNEPHATSVLLQGSPKTASTMLFMFPDGSGSASSYAAMAKIDSKIAVYGLNCPWRVTPEDMVRSKCTIRQLSAKYVKELMRRQPTGPYHLGGWSAGGICAFEAARQLVAAGELIETLILIDSPNPIGLQNPPARMYDFFQQLGIFGTGAGIPKWLRPHFDAFISMLDDYEPTPWSQNLGLAPRTLVIYAPDGVCKVPDGPRPEIRPDDPREMIWLINQRTDFSAEGWASLLGRDRISVKVLEEVHHFSMMDSGSQMDKMCLYMKEWIS
ncbi:hypothetical protein BGZ63DRAFT_423145 [Mariannaea sp. PMI_226]|nr:hypothetical protein BGZ63DRAFT_423145 [Mariannaea sp. PMI_226]